MKVSERQNNQMAALVDIVLKFLRLFILQVTPEWGLHQSFTACCHYQFVVKNGQDQICNLTREIEKHRRSRQTRKSNNTSRKRHHSKQMGAIHGSILCPIEGVDSSVTVHENYEKFTIFRLRRAVGFDRASGSINCPSGSKLS